MKAYVRYWQHIKFNTQGPRLYSSNQTNHVSKPRGTFAVTSRLCSRISSLGESLFLHIILWWVGLLDGSFIHLFIWLSNTGPRKPPYVKALLAWLI